MTFNSRGWVSVVELVVFIPSLLLSIYICSRHGFHRSSGWIYTLILCIVRIAGAVCQLLTYHDTSTGLLKATLIIDSIGLSPLLLATLGMLSRLVDWINVFGQSFLTLKHFRLLQLLISLGLILSIAGGSGGSTSDNGTPTISTTSKVSIVLFIVGFVGIFLVWLVSVPNAGLAPGREKSIAGAVIIALPFILVRLAYSALAVFVHNHTFNIVDGSVAVHVAMAVVEEFIVVGIYLVLGFMLRPLQQNEQGPIASRPWKENKSQRSGSKRRRSRERDSGQRNSGKNSHFQAGVHSLQPVYHQTRQPEQEHYVPSNGMRPTQGYGQV